MTNTLVYPLGSTPACLYAVTFIKKRGIAVVDHPTPEITHLLLDVPSFSADGALRGGGNLQHTLQMLPGSITVCGGNLSHPVLSGYRTLDFLQDESYLAGNAAITADCALRVAAPLMKTAFAGTKVLIIGWGRIGKCLGQLLKAVGADVIIAARQEAHRAMIRALGVQAVDICEISNVLPSCRVVFNTVPEMIIHKEQFVRGEDCIKVDLASRPGIEGDDVVWARGLPGVLTPESSGRLIADTFLKHTGR